MVSATVGANLPVALIESRKNTGRKFGQSLALQVTLSHLAEVGNHCKFGCQQINYISGENSTVVTKIYIENTFI